MREVDPDWWKTMFDDTYLITDARSVCDDRLTHQEVDFLERVLKLKKSWPILDLCGGQGRHALELCRRGYQDVTVLDYSKFLVDLGKSMAQKSGFHIPFVCRDARDTGLPNGRFKTIIVMASSFGYFIDESENQKILREAFRLLTSRGLLVLDLPDRDQVIKQFRPQSWHEVNDEIVVCRQRRLKEEIVYCREMVISKTRGLIRDGTYCTRLYGSENIRSLLKSRGFSSVTTQRDSVSHREKEDRGFMTNRVIVIAQKA